MGKAVPQLPPPRLRVTTRAVTAVVPQAPPPRRPRVATGTAVPPPPRLQVPTGAGTDTPAVLGLHEGEEEACSPSSFCKL
jgi:hypothetical protein